MPQPEPSSHGAITLDQLIALNDEIAALVRAGVPLERGLAELGRDMPGRLGRITTLLAERMERGKSLSEVLAGEPGQFPPIYRAVVEAGLRSGRLPAALEALAGSTRRLAETRRTVAAAAVYPLIVLMVAWGLFAFFAARIAPVMLHSFDRLEVAGRGLLGCLAYCGRWAGWWGPAVPVIVLLLAAVWWFRSGRAAVAEPRGAARLLGWLPWIGNVLKLSRTATFVEVLALLIENRVPLDEAVVLAAEAGGDREILPAARRLADALKRGESLAAGSASAAGGAEFPPLLCWLMAAGRRHGALPAALKHAAEAYHRRARNRADLVRTFLPIVLTVAIGGSVVLLYALTLFVPYTSMLKALGGV